MQLLFSYKYAEMVNEVEEKGNKTYEHGYWGGRQCITAWIGFSSLWLLSTYQQRTAGITNVIDSIIKYLVIKHIRK